VYKQAEQQEQQQLLNQRVTMKVIAAVLVAIGCLILIGLLAFMGKEVSKLTQVGPCLGKASGTVAELASLPELFKKKTAELQEEITVKLPQELQNKSGEIQEKLKADPFNAELLKQQAVLPGEMEAKRQNLTTQITEMGESLKRETCKLGKKIPAKFVGCASDVENNFLFKSFVPKGMPSTDGITAFVEKTMLSAGCNITNDTTTEEEANGGSSGLPGWAAGLLTFLALALLIAGCILCCIGGDDESEDLDDEEADQREIRGYTYVENRDEEDE